MFILIILPVYNFKNLYFKSPGISNKNWVGFQKMKSEYFKNICREKNSGKNWVDFFFQSTTKQEWIKEILLLIDPDTLQSETQIWGVQVTWKMNQGSKLYIQRE